MDTTEIKKISWNIEKKPHSITQLSATIPATDITKKRQQALSAFKKQISVDGFRDGNIPDTFVVSRVGEQAITEAAAEMAVRAILTQTLIDHALMPISSPEIHIQVAESGDASVTITVVTYPSVTLPDYTTIAKHIMDGVAEVTISEDEVVAALVHFRRERMRVEAIEAGQNAEDALTQAEKTAVEELPPLDDAFVTQIGFATVAAFEENIRTHLHSTKTDQERSERRAKILTAITDGTTTDVPEPLIEYEIAKMEAGIAEYLAPQQKTFEDYLIEVKKTRDELHTEWRATAEKRAKSQLALIEIGKREHVHEDPEEVEKIVESVMSHNPKADSEAVRAHYSVILRNERIMEFLEGKPVEPHTHDDHGHHGHTHS
jgi:FKBP-type peptidyl-prolyl cis-trans isomerase (trigger factor)